MRIKRTLATGVAAFCIMGLAAAQAQTLYIGFGPVGSIATVAVGSVFLTGSGVDFAGQASDFKSGADLLSLFTYIPYFSAGTETIWVSESGIELPTADAYNINFKSGFTNNQMPPGATVTESAYVSEGDSPYGTTTLLGSATFSSLDAAGVSVLAGPIGLTGPYTLTQVYEITAAPSLDAFGLSIDIKSVNAGPRPPVPEPSTWAMMLTGFAGLGYAALRTRKGRISAIA